MSRGTDVKTVAGRLNDAGTDETTRSLALKMAMAGALTEARPADLRELGLAAIVGDPWLGVSPYRLPPGGAPILVVLGRAAEVTLAGGPAGRAGASFLARVVAPPGATRVEVTKSLAAMADAVRRADAFWTASLITDDVALLQRWRL